MLRAFSSIRQNLLYENKSVKYLKYAVGEILLIMIGIILAVQFNNWNEHRLERIEERIILERIAEEARRGLNRLPFFLDTLEGKRNALNRIARSFEGDAVEDELSFLSDVASGAVFGYTIPRIPRVAFDEIVNSGKLGLVVNVELRVQISTYFENAKHQENRVDDRRGAFPKMSYDLVPRNNGNELEVEMGLSAERYQFLVSRTLKSDLDLYITGEQNYADFLDRIWNSIQQDGNELLAAIETELRN